MKHTLRAVGACLTLLMLIACAKDSLTDTTPPPPPPPEKKKRIFTLVEENVTKFFLEFDGNALTVEKEGKNNWFLVSPIRLPVETDEAIANVKNFNSLYIVAEVAKPTNSASYKLFPRQARFVVWEDAVPHTVDVGSKSDDGSLRLISYNDRFFHVAAWSVEALKKNIDDLRRRDFLRSDMRDIIRVTINADYIFSREGGEWVFNRVTNDIDEKKIITLVQHIGLITAIGYGATDRTPRDYDLDPGEVVVDIGLSSGETRVLYLARHNGALYARLADEPYVYEVESDLYSRLMEPASYYRKPESDGITRIRKTEATLTLRKGDHVYFTPKGLHAMIRVEEIIDGTIRLRVNDMEGTLSRANRVLVLDSNWDGRYDIRIELSDIGEGTATITITLYGAR